ncbi:nicotinate-nucleotide--dimethylbenzimidazole phosphoribosyltransferase [Anaerocolumna cellulosilytica]|uniref:Nicotinate-nucleotide--dimethylbenzimidazole phosphoribosyltransferase n=1 Tax=Anaerocolumna cellulosilytica TaxID=433286 RepID=A0A6S6R0F2_9FIRM|nr:nicotinate-nucleotide--dimethylbenzimidazole phosphoribosyltransferase [Anaerocolumna cellulosilytica]MBB5196366.1 nicotinate-nucleotide--dimethylbenzimidazole phosphoribosyltransferase [Anaerocolumna cellulosilytica]BCJ96394.1 nicotinate-nucleotide--dimethylbenzimidazole phosphoribosyltransferase [Anaerocolumna cellulosilytica]
MEQKLQETTTGRQMPEKFCKEAFRKYTELQELIQNTYALDGAAITEAKKRWDSIAKPIGSLGIFEDMIGRLAGIQKTPDILLHQKAMVVFCSDNGVVEEGVTQTDSSVTAIVTRNIAKGCANINHMARTVNAQVIPVDMGINSDIVESEVWQRKVSYGTGNIAKEPAMTSDNMLKALQTGIELAGELKAKGFHILGTGEMGIGNTTTSSAVASALLHLLPEEVTGRGAGLSDDGLKRKIQVIYKALEINRPDREDPFDILMKLGGYDIAGMAGLYLGGMKYGVPVIIDGFISSVAALVAKRICPEVVDFMLPSHKSKEPAANLILKELGLTPVIAGNLALGEGTGAVMLFPLLDMALSVYRSSTTFDAIQIKAYERFELS